MITLLNGDCFELLKDIRSESVDMILTDPPYGMNYQSNMRTVNKYDKIKNDGNLDWLDGTVAEMYRVAKDNTAHYVFCSFHMIDKFKQSLQKRFKVRNILVWVKNETGMGDINGDFRPVCEFIFLLHKGRRVYNGRRDPNVFHFKETGNINHPTEKPIDLCAYLISKFSNEGDVVLDMFMGSGSTGVAAKKMRRGFIGIELNEQYYKTAKKRIDAN